MALLTAGTANEDGPLDHDLLNVMAPNGYGGDGGNGGDAGGGEGGGDGGDDVSGGDVNGGVGNGRLADGSTEGASGRRRRRRGTGAEGSSPGSAAMDVEGGGAAGGGAEGGGAAGGGAEGGGAEGGGAAGGGAEGGGAAAGAERGNAGGKGCSGGSEGAGSDRDTQMQSAPVESAPVVLREESTPVVLREVSRSSSTIASDQAKRDLRELVVKKRKIWRTLVFGLVLGLVYACWCIAVLPAQWVELTQPYNPANTLELLVSSCDVDFVQGDATIKYAAMLQSYSVAWTNDVDANTVRSAVFGNLVGCSGMPRSSCRRRCLVTISVPPDSSTAFQVDQAEDDPAWPIVTVTPGTTVHTINLGVSSAPTISLFVDTASVSGSLGGQLRRGEVRAHNASIAAISMTIAEDGSFYLLDLEAADKDLDLTFRNAENRLCLGTDRAASEVSVVRDVDPFAHCDIRPILDGLGDASSAWGSYDAFRGQYDADSDQLVTRSEFVSGLDSLLCCGGACPFASDCAGQSYEVGFFSSLDGKALSDFARLVLATSRTNWFPECTSHLRLNVEGEAAAGTQTLSHLHSEKGEVVVTLKQGGSHVWGEPRTAFHASPPSQPGLHLLQADAQRLMSKYGKEFGDRDSSGDAVLVIDVFGGAGYPTTRWLYASNPAYLTIDPPHLTFLTMGMLTPPIIFERVRFADGDCLFEALNTSTALVEMANGLRRSLFSSASDPGELRGKLVLVGDELADVWGNMILYHFPLEGSKRYQRPWKSPLLSSTLRTSIALSTTVGALLGLMATALFFRYFAHVERQRWQKAQAARYIVLSKIFPPGKVKTVQEKEQREGAYGFKPTGNPFLAPFDIIQAVAVEPVRRRWVSTIEKFVRERMIVQQPADDRLEEGTTHQFIYMHNFCQQYEMFCLEHNLPMVQSRDEIQRKLIKKFNVHVHQILVRRIYGIRWREPHDPPADPEQLIPITVGKSVQDSDSASIKAFVAETCIVDPMPGSWIDLHERPGPNGTIKPGFRTELYKWCQARSRHQPHLEGRAWARHLPKHTKFRDRQKVRQIRGLRWNLNEVPVKLNYKWFLLEACVVAVEVLAFFLLPLLTIFYAMVMQHMWGVIMCPHDGVVLDNGERMLPVLWTDVARPVWQQEPQHMLLLVRIILYENIAFMILTILRLLMHFLLRIPRDGFLRLVNLLYAAVLGLHMVMALAYFGIIGCWFILAAVLDPTRFLPYGMAAIVIVVVAVTVSSEMIAAAKHFKQKLWGAFQKALQLKLKLAMDKLEQELYDKMMREESALASNAENESYDEEEQVRLGVTVEKPELNVKGRDVTPVDIFMALNSDGDQHLSMEQFKRLFDLLELDVTETQKEQLFAFCDTDMTGQISEKEFADGWDTLVEVFLENSADSLGLSRAQIFCVVFMLVTTLALVVVFILLTLNAWRGGSFEAFVQSILISGAGKATAALRSRSKAENADSLDGLVDKIMSEQEENASDMS